MKSKQIFQFSTDQLQDLRDSVKAYFLDELEMEIGDLQVDLFIEFLNNNAGKKYYNLGVTDTIASVKDKADDLLLLIKE